MRVKLTIQYDGTNFCGWQSQPSLRTVQTELESAIFKLTGENSRVTASGRTDAGVHALGQVAHFDTNKDLGKKFVSGLNYFLPDDVRIRSAEAVGDNFHARFSAKQKTYMYLMYESDIDNPLLRYRATRTGKLDVEAMQDASELFLGKRDFATFRSTGSDTETTVRTVNEAKVRRSGEFVTFTVTADGFLYNMVRIMTAMLIKVGLGEITESDVENIIAAKDRNKAKFLAPAKALYLQKVVYTR